MEEYPELTYEETNKLLIELDNDIGAMEDYVKEMRGEKVSQNSEETTRRKKSLYSIVSLDCIGKFAIPNNNRTTCKNFRVFLIITPIIMLQLAITTT